MARDSKIWSAVLAAQMALRQVTGGRDVAVSRAVLPLPSRVRFFASHPRAVRRQVALRPVNACKCEAGLKPERRDQAAKLPWSCQVEQTGTPFARLN